MFLFKVDIEYKMLDLEKSFSDNNSESHKIENSFSSVKIMFEVKTDGATLFDSFFKDGEVLLPYHCCPVIDAKKNQ